MDQIKNLTNISILTYTNDPLENHANNVSE